MNKALSSLQHLLRLVGIDKKVGTGLVARAIGIISAPIGSLLTVWKLSAEQQGLYYLFGSLLALRVLFELGVGTSVIQVAAYARVSESNGEGGPLESSFVAVVNRWMLKVASWYGVLAGIGGMAFISYQGHGSLGVLSAWLVFIVVGSLQFASEGRWALVEGAGLVSEANLLRIKNNIIQSLALWIALLSGLGLFSFCIAAALGYTSQEYRFRVKHPWMYVSFRRQTVERIEHYKNELLTLIKKASQTYLTGYFVFQIQQPICFMLLGAAASARLGFTQSVGTTFIGLPSIWLAMNFPKLAHHVADQEVSEAATLFRTKWTQVSVLAVVAGMLSWAVTLVLAEFPKFHDRLMDSTSTGLLFLAMTIQTIALGLTYWPRAFKVEPFVRIAYTQMVLTPVFLWFGMSKLGLLGASVGNLGSWIVGLVGIALIFKGFWNPSKYQTRSSQTSSGL